MYEYTGEKIKGFAKIIGWVCLIAGAIAWTIMISNTVKAQGLTYVYTADDDLAWVCLFAGVVGFFCSWLAYGFGQLVEDVSDIREKQEQLHKVMAEIRDAGKNK